MNTPDYTHVLTQVVDKLSDSNSFGGLFHQHKMETLCLPESHFTASSNYHVPFCFQDTSEPLICTPILFTSILVWTSKSFLLCLPNRFKQDCALV